MQLTDIGKCVERFKQSRFLVVGAGNAGQEIPYLGAIARYVDFDALQPLYDAVSPEAATEWAERWTRGHSLGCRQVRRAEPADFGSAAAALVPSTWRRSSWQRSMAPIV